MEHPEVMEMYKLMKFLGSWYFNVSVFAICFALFFSGVSAWIIIAGLVALTTGFLLYIDKYDASEHSSEDLK
jgi:hypothetical protein